MPAALLDLAELKRFIEGTPASHDALLQEILDETEEQLLRACGRQFRPFAAAQSARAEIRDGNSSATLWLDYAIGAAPSAIWLGRDTSSHDEDIDPTDVEAVIYEIGRRRIVRTDGGLWGCSGDPLVVHVTYNAAADLPLTAQKAVKRMCALVYNQRGSEDATREQIGGYVRDLAKTDPIWEKCVELLEDPGL